MKTLKILPVLLAFFFLTGTISTNAENPPVFPDNLNKHIVAEILYPDAAKSEKIEGFVLVTFNVEDDGYIKISGINASDNILKTYVEEKLLEIRLCPYDLSVGKEFSMKFDFQLLLE